MKLTTEIVKLDYIVGKDRTQAIVEADVIVPDTKPDVLKVLQTDAKAMIKGSEVLQDKVSVDIGVKFEILYVGEERTEPMYAITSRSEINQILNIPGSRNDMSNKCKCRVEHVDSKILNPRKLNVKAIIEIEGAVEKDEKVAVITDVQEDETVQLLKNKIKLNSTAGAINVPMVLKQDMDIPSGKPFAKNIIKVNAAVSDREIKVYRDKLECRGMLRIGVIYISDPPEAQIELIEEEFPFNELLDMPGSDDSMGYMGDFEVEEVAARVKEDDDGDNSIIQCEATVRAKIEVYETAEKELVVDSYSTQRKLDIDRKTVSLNNFVGENELQAGIKDIMAIPEAMPAITEVLNIEASPLITGVTAEDGRVMIEGIMDVGILYLSDDETKPMQNLVNQLPVKQVIEIPNAKRDMKITPRLSVEHASYSILSNKEIELRIVISAGAAVHEVNRKQLIVDINPLEETIGEKDNLASIIVYVVQEGETMWDIAKRYYATTEQLAAINGIEEPYNINAGQKIYIFKNIRV